MIYLDTNVVLRYLLEDHAEFFPRSVELIENNDVYIKNEVLAEIVYVLHKTYSVSKQDLSTVLIDFLNMDTILIQNKLLVLQSRFFLSVILILWMRYYAHCKNRKILLS
jgi:predicted nucleic-acid-binding protein